MPHIFYSFAVRVFVKFRQINPVILLRSGAMICLETQLLQSARDIEVKLNFVSTEIYSHGDQFLKICMRS